MRSDSTHRIRFEEIIFLPSSGAEARGLEFNPTLDLCVEGELLIKKLLASRARIAKRLKYQARALAPLGDPRNQALCGKG